MAIAPTGAIYKSLIFDGEDSRDYGVYITGEAVYNAPERDVEMIAIPGRNGAYALDNGRFENIEVMYPAGIYADNETDFAEAISDFRNFLCSKKGYCRLEDEYNPNEYRMAVYRSGLEVSPTQLQTGEFKIIFECKPQRWLTSGEEAVTVESGDTLTNPTRFDSSPLLEVEGYGTIKFNGHEIELAYAPFGDITLFDNKKYTTKTKSISFSSKEYNAGDTITIDGTEINWFIDPNGDGTYRVGTVSVSDSAATVGNTVLVRAYDPTENRGRHIYKTQSPALVFTAGNYETKSDTVTITVQILTYSEGSWVPYTTETLSVTWSIQYTQDDINRDMFTFTFTENIGTLASAYMSSGSGMMSGTAVANSSKTYLGNPTYIDCDLGEAYLINDGVPVSLNKYIDLGSDLPELTSGSNEFTLDNTITELKVVPRWWKI